MRCLLIAIAFHLASALMSVRRASSCKPRLLAVKSPRQIVAEQIMATAAPLLAAVLAPTATMAAQKFYLTEPTQDFKEEVARTDANKATRQKNRQRWDGLLDRLEKAEAPDSLESVLKDMKVYLAEGMVPPDFNKMDLVKLCRKKKLLNPENKRSKKTKPEWTTPVEIAYQALVQEYNKQLLPNNKSEENPF